ncbi:hypothetical protein C8R43DRAFT_936860 [Mycena crocata]|nr:hypothetical protein C8R43DRAFT_936860 [Mycena crocata]
MSSPPPTLEEGLALLETFSDIDNVNEAAKALSLLVTTYSVQPGPALDRRFVSVDACVKLLSRAPELHKMLKDAHSAKNYDSVRNSDLIRKDTLPRGVREMLDALRPLLVAFMNAEKCLTPWISRPQPTDPITLDHMKSLQLSSLQSLGRPLVILKDLGSFGDDPNLLFRVRNIFVRGKKTVLVNTSGSGKTRLLFEGLCCEWGFYFVSAEDSIGLGSRDIRDMESTLKQDANFSSNPPTQATEVDTKLKYNNLKAHRLYSGALLARLLIFRMFLDIANEGGLTEEHKRRWLLLQLHPRLGLYLDVFDSLTMLLCEDAGRETQENISDAITSIQNVLGPDWHLFLVLDEAQKAALALPDAFDAESGRYPLLSKILDTWDSCFPQESVSFVIAGTQVNSNIFEEPRHTGRVRWTSDTGTFDDQSAHERYLRRFLPPGLLATEEGEDLLRRVWIWTRGRYRYTASFLVDLLEFNFQNPHTLFDKYIAKICEFTPTDGSQWVKGESKNKLKMPSSHLELRLIGNDFSPIDDSRFSETRFVLQDVVFHHLVAEGNPPPLDQTKIQTVSLGLGRFVDGEMKKIEVDESIVLAGAALWMSQPPTTRKSTALPFESPHNYLTMLQRYPPHTAKAFAKCLVFYFVHAFSAKPLLSEIFDFGKPVSTWAKQSVELVELHVTEDAQLRYSVVTPSDFSGPLAVSASNLDEVVAWMEHRHHTPFCLPVFSNPDLIFVLKLADGSLMSVVVQSTPTATDGIELLGSLEQENLFCDEKGDPEAVAHKRAVELLNALPNDSGTYKSASPNVLRVVASFSDQIVLKTRTTKAAPQASLSMDMFQQLAATVSSSEVVATVVANVLNKRKEQPEAGKGKGRPSKRQNSFPVASGSDDEVGKGKKKARSTPAPEASTRVLRPRPARTASPVSGSRKPSSRESTK